MECDIICFDSVIDHVEDSYINEINNHVKARKKINYNDSLTAEIS